MSVKKTTYLLLSFILFLSTVTLVQAQSNSTESADIDPESIRTNIKERIQKAVNQTTQQASPSTGWYGLVSSLTQDTITITVDQIPKLVGITPETQILDMQDEGDLSDIEIDAPIIAIGAIDPNDILSATKIIVPQEPAETSNKITISTTIKDLLPRSNQIITASSSAKPTTILTYTRDSELTDQFPTTSDDVIIDLDNLNIGDKIIAIYQPSKNDPSVLNLLLLHRVFSNPGTDADTIQE